ncbi:alpha-(1,3)-fucosyltransferase C-like [Centruroides vittatus]|uniref:alpha-(1,3)-fucosyltransferase C-like n=1 Tax=Centruroides vittatus TaxID=120091 RepID=UPI0035108EE3
MITRLSTCRTCLIVTMVLSVLALYLLLRYNPVVYRYVAQSSVLLRSDKVILLWTPFFGIRDYMPVGEGALSHSGCPESRCEVTTDRTRLLHSEAIVFHCRDVSVVDLPLHRKPEQKWIYYCLEAPPHSYFAAFRFMRRMFNWTMSYRLDSDVVTSYGSYAVNGNRSDVPDGLLDVWRGKKKHVVWLVSNCPTSGNREGFVDRLKSYIDVDVYGSCGKGRCPNDKLDECLDDYVRNYMFFLALENSLCKDYVTEKFFRILKYNIIPIVFGDANYSRVAPPDSYIDALSYRDAEHLAQHLRNVASDYNLYKSYFKWKDRFHISPSLPLICELCRKLHTSDVAPYKVYDDIAAWWVEDSACRRWRGQ